MMATKLGVVCDVCAIEKKETNNWFKVSIFNDGLHIYPSHTILPRKHPYRDVCGHVCAQKLLGRWMSHRTLEMEKPEKEA
jgi:hypothetical protein